MNSLLLLTILSCLTSTYAYHILCIFPVPSRSHNTLARGIVNPLLKAGHEVTWVTPYPPKETTKNLNIIDASLTVPIAARINMIDKKNFGNMAVVRGFATNISRTAMELPGLKEALIKNRYDAVITEWFFSDTDAGYAAVQQAPWILLSGLIMHPHMEYLVDEVRTVSTLPLMFNNFPVPMNFWQRLMNTFAYFMMEFDEWSYYPKTEALYSNLFTPIAKARGIELPPFRDAKFNMSILLVNSHSSFAPSQSLPPNVVEIAGYHIEENTPPLPTDLKDIMDKSPQGVVYFSMGSVLKSANFPEKTKREIIKIFGSLPYTVLWKFEEKLDGLPMNVHIRPWMPQASILAHPNIKVFITHGGLLSTLESLRYGVPLLAIPVFGDQHTNANRAVGLGYAQQITFDDDMEQEFDATLKEMLKNDRYYKRVKYLSKLFNNRPVPQSKLISHYVELAIETKGAFHLRSKSKLYTWYQRWMLDQVAVILAVLYLTYKLIKKIFGLCFGKKSATKVKKN